MNTHDIGYIVAVLVFLSLLSFPSAVGNDGGVGIGSEFSAFRLVTSGSGSLVSLVRGLAGSLVSLVHGIGLGRSARLRGRLVPLELRALRPGASSQPRHISLSESARLAMLVSQNSDSDSEPEPEPDSNSDSQPEPHEDLPERGGVFGAMVREAQRLSG